MSWVFDLFSDKPEVVVSIAGLVVSICALGYTAYQAYLSREHNKLSVKPSLTTWSDTTYDHITGCYTYESTLMNAGLGPAYIKSYEVLIDGVPVKATTFSDLHQAIVKGFPHYTLVSSECYYGLLRKTHVIAANERTMIGKLVFVAKELNAADGQRLNVRIVYESAYKAEQVYDSRDHFDNRPL
jgi:hypothetical protein